MPQSQIHFPGKGREALRQKSYNSSFKIYGLTVHIIRILKFTNKIFQFFKLSHKVIIPANYADFAQFAHTVRELRETRTFC